MRIHNPGLKDRSLQNVIGNLLRWGVIVSLLVVLISGFIYLLQSGSQTPSYHLFEEGGNPYTSLTDVVRGLSGSQTLAFIQLGVLILIATPIARIFFALIGFMKEKDYLYVIISLVVLGIIAASMLSGVKG
ncbi:MAG: hypothetical protein JWN76_2908 [Chitinophagaceae bacterium]|nr:hypothetical protein [Chitinophagaceae bacterium]